MGHVRRLMVVAVLIVGVLGGAVVERVTAAGTTTVAGVISQVQLFETVGVPSTPAPQPDTTPFLLPSASTTVVVPGGHHAVLTIGHTNTNPIGLLSCAGHTDEFLAVVDGRVIGPNDQFGNVQSSAWSPRLGPGTHTIGYALRCRVGDDNPGDTYLVVPDIAIRVERIEA
jgi:hypothetical protein